MRINHLAKPEKLYGFYKFLFVNCPYCRTLNSVIEFNPDIWRIQPSQKELEKVMKKEFKEIQKMKKKDDSVVFLISCCKHFMCFSKSGYF